MKRILFTILALFLFAGSYAQSPVGKWKLVQCFTQLDANNVRDELAGMFSKQPCLKKLVYVFSSDGMISLEENDCADVDPVDISAFGTKWKAEKSKITVFIDEFDTITFGLAVSANEMTWRAVPEGTNQEVVYVFTKQP